MNETEHADCADPIRIDRLLVYLRFARTRAVARGMIESGALRRNRQHVRRVSECVCVGDVITFMQGKDVRIVELLSLPERRHSPADAKAFYRELDRG